MTKNVSKEVEMWLTFSWDEVSPRFTMKLNFNNSGWNLQASIKPVLGVSLNRRSLSWQPSLFCFTVNLVSLWDIL